MLLVASMRWLVVSQASFSMLDLMLGQILPAANGRVMFAPEFALILRPDSARADTYA
jgi:hypothetical protein